MTGRTGFEIRNNKGNEIEGFVIMPNHLHLLIFVNDNENINLLLTNGKRFLAYEVIKRLELKHGQKEKKA